MSTLAVELSQHDDAVCLALSGELDLSSALTFEDQLRRIEEEAQPRVLVLDLRALKFLDSTGLRLIRQRPPGAWSAAAGLRSVQARTPPRGLSRLVAVG